MLVFGSLVWLAGCGQTTPVDGAEGAAVIADCTLTQGYWKNHPQAWAVTSLKLGNLSYNQTQLLAIFNTPVKGNGLIDLAHQLIAAKLNVAQGASASSISGAIAAADSLIGSLVVPPIGTGSLKTGATSALTGALDGYNSGATGPGHCGDAPPPPPPPPVVEPPPPPVCGNGKLEAGEECDDGNTVSGDGCSCVCMIEPPPPPPPPPPPVCGNGKLEAGEQCDDGNTVSGDGCSCTCTIEPPPPVCAS
jgi:cysteine-rich repeat protein